MNSLLFRLIGESSGFKKNKMNSAAQPGSGGGVSWAYAVRKPQSEATRPQGSHI